MNRLDKRISIAKDMAGIKGHWLVPFKKISPTMATSHCKNCGGLAQVDIKEPYNDIGGDVFSGARCEKRVKKQEWVPFTTMFPEKESGKKQSENPFPDPAMFGQKRRDETFRVLRRSKKHNW